MTTPASVTNNSNECTEGDSNDMKNELAELPIDMILLILQRLTQTIDFASFAAASPRIAVAAMRYENAKLKIPLCWTPMFDVYYNIGILPKIIQSACIYKKYKAYFYKYLAMLADDTEEEYLRRCDHDPEWFQKVNPNLNLRVADMSHIFANTEHYWSIHSIDSTTNPRYPRHDHRIAAKRMIIGNAGEHQRYPLWLFYEGDKQKSRLYMVVTQPPVFVCTYFAEKYAPVYGNVVAITVKRDIIPDGHARYYESVQGRSHRVLLELGGHFDFKEEDEDDAKHWRLVRVEYGKGKAEIFYYGTDGALSTVQTWDPWARWRNDPVGKRRVLL